MSQEGQYQLEMRLDAFLVHQEGGNNTNLPIASVYNNKNITIVTYLISMTNSFYEKRPNRFT